MSKISTLMYLRIPLYRLVCDYHKANMRGRMIEYSYDARKDEVIIEVLIEEKPCK